MKITLEVNDDEVEAYYARQRAQHFVRPLFMVRYVQGC